MPAIARPLDGLPEHLIARPFVTGDAQAFHAMYAAAELHDAGEAAIEVADVIGDWARPSVDLARHSMGVWDGDLLVAGCDVYRTRRADGVVLPSHRGRGIGSALARWTQAVCAADGGTRVGMTVPAGSDGEVVFADLGYHRGWTSWVLQLPPEAEIADRPLPDGYALRDVDPATELPLVHRVVEAAFNEWPERQPFPYEDWMAAVPERDGFAPWQMRVVTGPDGAIVGVCTLMLAEHTAYVDQLAVCRTERGRGLAQALLADGFGNGRAHGATVSELSTDSRTGALPLYERLGMLVTQTWHHWQIDVTPTG
ncbi:MAG: GNAT family N-acetyltransferase [Nostocoides sp.]